MPVQFDQSKLGTVTFAQVATFASALTYTFPTAQGANSELLRSNGSGGLIWLANNGLSTAMSSTLLTTGAGATTNISILNPAPVAIGGSANMSLAFVPQTSPGVSTWLAQVPDATAVGGNSRGTYAYDFQKSRTAANQVASGVNSTILGGANNQTLANFSVVAGGFGNVITSNVYAVSAIMGGSGNSITGGLSTTSNFCSILGGSGNTITITGAATSISAAQILGGLNNTLNGNFSTVLGGYGAQGRGYQGAYILPQANPLGLSSSNALCQAVIMPQGGSSSTTVGTAFLGSTGSGTSSTTNFGASNNCVSFVYGYMLGGRPDVGSKFYTFDGLFRKATTAASMTKIGGTGPFLINGTGGNVSVVTFNANTTGGWIDVGFTLASSIFNQCDAFMLSCEVTY